MGNGSFTPCAMTRKRDKYQQLATSQAQINGVLLRLPSQADHLRRLASKADDLIAGNGGMPPDHWKDLTGILKAVTIAKGSHDPENAITEQQPSISQNI